DLLRRAHAPHRVTRQHRLEQRRIVLLDDIPYPALERDIAGRDHVGADVFRREVAGERLDTTGAVEIAGAPRPYASVKAALAAYERSRRPSTARGRAAPPRRRLPFRSRRSPGCAARTRRPCSGRAR